MDISASFPPIDYAAELNPDQLAAVTSESRHALVLAGAGSGKTRTLTYRVAWLLEQGVPPWRILLLTFTNKAAAEMLERIEDLTGIPRSQFWGGTFHSVGQRLLRMNAPAAGIRPDFTILDADDADSLFAAVCRQIAPNFIKGKNSPTPRVIFEVLSYARNTTTPLENVVRERLEWAEGAQEIVPRLLAEYTAAKRTQNACDYDDLLELFRNLLRDDPPSRERYHSRFRHILVDEFQDTNTLQSEIIRLLAGPDTHVMAVGDDAQCIYTWRGADYRNIVDFPETFAGTRIHKIEINYRSTPEILDFSNSILEARTEEAGFSKRLRATRGNGLKPALIPQTDAFSQARAVVSKIRTLVEDEGYSLSDIIVLYRAHFQAKELQLELTNFHVPFVITSGIQFFQQAHVRDFVAQLRFVQNHNDAVAFTRVLSLIEKIGPRTAERVLVSARKVANEKSVHLLVALLDSSILKKIPEVARDDYRDLVLTLQNMTEALCGRELSAGNVPEENPSARAAAAPPPAKKSGNASASHGELFDFFALEEEASRPSPDDDFGAETSFEPETRSSFGGDAPASDPRVHAAPAEIVRIGIDGWYGDFLKKIYPNWQQRYDDLESMIGFAEKFDTLPDLLAQLALLNTETTDKDMRERDGGEASLRLSTIHQSKGLEFPVVFVIGCADGLFPLRRSIEDGDTDEERRLFYVACTRAKDRLYLLYPKIGSGRDPALLDVSRFIREANPSAYRKLYGSAREY